jgi:acetyltransferase-like isoleucine patch superfamily enzyme
VTKSIIRRAANRVFALLARFSPGARTLRVWLHRARGVKIGRGVFIGDEVYIDNEYPECVEIQAHAQISIRAIIIAHTRGPGRVVIGKDAFLGANSVIACSAGCMIRIGERAVIGPGTIITKSVPAGLYLVPAPPQFVAKVGVPLSTTDSIRSFRAGLRPLAGRSATDDAEPQNKGGSDAAPNQPGNLK